MKKIVVTAAFALAFCALGNDAFAQFNYPAQSCNSGGCLSGRHGGRMENFRAKVDHYSAINEKVRARSDAWPKPFACWDRQAYYNVWQPMLTNGFEQHCVLGDSFFSDTQELNRIGISKVADIMQNMPQQGRTVFIQKSLDEAVNQARLDQVKNTINKYYAHLGVAKVSFSRKTPAIASGIESDLIRQNRRDSMPLPLVQAGTGESVNQAVAGQ